MYLILYLLYPNGKQQIIYIGACAKPLKVDWGHLYGLQWELALGGFAHLGPDVFCWRNDLMIAKNYWWITRLVVDQGVLIRPLSSSLW